LDEKSRKDMYYDIRDAYNSRALKNNQPDVERAAQFIFLNRTCLTGFIVLIVRDI